MIGLKQPQSLQFSHIVVKTAYRAGAYYSILIHRYQELTLSAKIDRLVFINVTQFVSCVKLLAYLFEGSLPSKDVPRHRYNDPLGL
jgi:hypothetical protein